MPPKPIINSKLALCQPQAPLKEPFKGNLGLNIQRSADLLHGSGGAEPAPALVGSRPEELSRPHRNPRDPSYQEGLFGPRKRSVNKQLDSSLYTYIFRYVNVYVYVYVHVFHVCLYIYIYIYIFAYIHIYIYADMTCVYRYMYIMYSYTLRTYNTNAHVHNIFTYHGSIYIYTHTHVYLYTHMFTRT